MRTPKEKIAHLRRVRKKYPELFENEIELLPQKMQEEIIRNKAKKDMPDAPCRFRGEPSEMSYSYNFNKQYQDDAHSITMLNTGMQLTMALKQSHANHIKFAKHVL